MNEKWEYLVERLITDFAIPGDMLSILFLVGIQESGEGFRQYDQQEKTDLVKLGKYTLLSRAGFYEKFPVPGRDPLFVPIDGHPLPADVASLDSILKNELLQYFNKYLTL